MSWLSDIQADIRAGLVSTVSDAEHMAQWRRRHWKQQRHDLRMAQSFALNYSIEELHRRIDAVQFSTSPYKDDMIRQCHMALKMKRRLTAGVAS